MGFRFRCFNPIYRTYISKISPHRHKNLSPIALLYPPIPQFQDPSGNPHFHVPRRWHLGHSHDPHHHLSGKEAENIFRLGLAADIGLAAGKALTGYLSGSTAIIADAVHSVSDVVLSGVALWSFKAGNAPKDEEHPYGHGKFETLGALGISCMLLGTAGGIAWHASEILLGLFSAAPDTINHSFIHDHNQHHSGHHHGIDLNHPILALNMTIVSIAVKEGLYWITKRAGEKQGSGLMKANAWHHRADAVSSLVALVGVGGSILGVKFLDPLAGLVVSGMILKAGIETWYQSVMELVDAAVPAQLLDPIRKTIVEVEGVKGCHRLRGRRAGSTLHLDVHIEVDPFSSVSAAHDVGENVRHEIHKSHPEVSEVFIHIDPAVPHVSSGTATHVMNACARDKYFEARNASGHDKDIEAIVCEIFLSKFPQMFVERVTRHVIQGKMLLQIEVSMPPEIMIRDAKEMAEMAEKEVLRAASISNVIQVSIQLCLGKAIQC